MFGKKRNPLTNEQLIESLLAMYKVYYHNEYPPGNIVYVTITTLSYWTDIKQIYKDRSSVNLSDLIDLVEELPIFNRVSISCSNTYTECISHNLNLFAQAPGE